MIGSVPMDVLLLPWKVPGYTGNRFSQTINCFPVLTGIVIINAEEAEFGGLLAKIKEDEGDVFTQGVY